MVIALKLIAQWQCRAIVLGYDRHYIHTPAIYPDALEESENERRRHKKNAEVCRK